jgi:hypothetical protein
VQAAVGDARPRSADRLKIEVTTFETCSKQVPADPDQALEISDLLRFRRGEELLPDPKRRFVIDYSECVSFHQTIRIARLTVVVLDVSVERDNLQRGGLPCDGNSICSRPDPPLWPTNGSTTPSIRASTTSVRYPRPTAAMILSGSEER